jgi:hypothetical protein
MSRIFKRPMFRKGGTTGGGIMDNVVERGQYAESNAKDFKSLSIEDKINLVEGLGGGKDSGGLGDPLTQFLLQIGPRLGTTVTGGGLIPNILEASKEPVSDLIKAQRDRRKTRQAIGLEFIKDLSDDDKIALQEKIEYLMDTFDISKEEALNRALPEFRKKKDPSEQATLDVDASIDSIINSTKNRFNVPKIDRIQGEILYDNLNELQKSNPDAYKTFVGAKSSSKYIFGSSEYKPETGEIDENSILMTIPDGSVVYDIEKGTFVKKQGNKIIGLE